MPLQTTVNQSAGRASATRATAPARGTPAAEVGAGGKTERRMLAHGADVTVARLGVENPGDAFEERARHAGKEIEPVALEQIEKLLGTRHRHSESHARR